MPENIRPIRSPAAAGSKITVYFPGSIAFALRDMSALSMAILEASAVSSLLTSLKLRATQPDPVPSLLRMVTVKSTLVAWL